MFQCEQDVDGSADAKIEELAVEGHLKFLTPIHPSPTSISTIQRPKAIPQQPENV
jgi:hypothetical protein